MGRRTWSSEQLEYLKTHFEKMEHGAIGLAIDKTRNAVRTKAWELRLRKKAGIYSDEEKQIIRDLYGAGVGYTVIALTLKRPETGICVEARKMGLTDMRRQKPDSVIAGMKERARGERAGWGKTGKRADLNGQFFRSRYEANYARLLNLFIKLEYGGGEIVRWDYEPDTFDFPVKRGTRFYTPDFKVFFKDGHIEYHEVKGWDYPKGKTARKRMAKYYSQVTLILIDADYFKALHKKHIDRLIPGWEYDH